MIVYNQKNYLIIDLVNGWEFIITACSENDLMYKILIVSIAVLTIPAI